MPTDLFRIPMDTEYGLVPFTRRPPNMDLCRLPAGTEYRLVPFTRWPPNMDLCCLLACTNYGLVPFTDMYCVRLCTVYRQTTAKVHGRKKPKFQSVLSLRWTPVELLVRDKKLFLQCVACKR